jgi:omega-6 fatty acid desaturase (delta-12 desaturase)
MGKGGESDKTVKGKAASTTTSNDWKLSKLSDEELRKWSKAYGEKEGNREEMLRNLNPYADGILDKFRPANLPLEMPPFTLATIKNAIPAHCFQRNAWISFGHVLSDLTIIGIFGFLATFIGTSALPVWSKYLLWPLYWYAQGSVMTGIWVLAHECGHQAFSESELINNTMGSILHSLLLVPYHSWRITHGKHHANTGSCENDEVFAPSTRDDWKHEMLRETPLAQIYGIVLMLTVGWMPGYLLFNATGPAKYRNKNANHFSPTAVFFDKKDYWLIVQTDIMFFLAVSLLAFSIYTFGFMTVGAFYLIPYMIVNYHLVLITYLQHTDVFMPHFRGTQWNWLRGALCTVDRSFGSVLDHTLHHIVDTHVCHHLFSKMPFYHAQEATVAIKKVLGKYYLQDNSSIAHALWRSFSACQFIEDEGDVVFFKNIK